MAKPITPRQRAHAALREVKGIRNGKWQGDPEFKKFGETMLDRYEALAKEIQRLVPVEKEWRGYG